MSGKIEQTKGRLKRAAGEAGRSDKLKREGQIEETAGKAKELKEKLQKMQDEITEGNV